MEQWKHRKTKKSELAFDKAMAARLYLLGAGFVLAFTAFAEIIALIRPAPGCAVQLMHFDPIVFFLSAQTPLWFAVPLELAAASFAFTLPALSGTTRWPCWAACLSPIN